MSWNLAYAHDANGNRLAGDKARLAEFVRNGQPVRFLVEYGDHVYVTDAQCLWVKSGTVYAQNTSHVSVDFQGALLKFQNDAYWWMVIADTSGNIDMSRWLVGAHTPKDHDSERRAMKWFVG